MIFKVRGSDVTDVGVIRCGKLMVSRDPIFLAIVPTVSPLSN